MRTSAANAVWVTVLVCVGLLLAQAADAMMLADFDNLSLDVEDYWNGSDLSGGFTTGGAVFNNNYDTNWLSWDGFAYSRVNDTNTPGFENQYAVISGTDLSGTGNYAVVYCSAFAVSPPTVTLPHPSTILGFHVNNTTYAALAMRDGNAFARQFGGSTGDDPDWFLMTATGRDATGADVGTVEFYLADFRFTNNAMDYILEDWTWVDLSSMGTNVSSLSLALTSSDMGAYGMNTPAYFAVDDMKWGVPRGPWWDGVDLGQGWRHSEWFGYLNDESYPWVYHLEHGWIYCEGERTGFLFWTDGLGFLWTADTVYPWVFDTGRGTWLYYFPGSANPRWFFNWATQEWEAR
ncbi:DUF4465 domain-containing protein [Verrucomicrobiota bacterium]